MPLALGLGGLLLSACGQGAAAGGDDPVAVVQAYMTAIQGGDASAGQAELESKSDEKIDGSTPASRYIAAHKGAAWKILTLNWIPPGSTAATSTQKECLIGAPPPSQICEVVVEVDGGGGKVWFGFAVENRYGPYQIISVDRNDTKPENLLPQGTEAHSAT
jgi:hypothetical protein